jgi:hypothetical protein
MIATLAHAMKVDASQAALSDAVSCASRMRLFLQNTANSRSARP